MEGLLTSVSTSYQSPSQQTNEFLVKVPQDPVYPSQQLYSKATNPAEALELLRNEPDYKCLVSILHYLADDSSGFSVISPSPIAAQLVYVIVSETVPTYWNVLQTQDSKQTQGRAALQSSPDADLLLSCLRSVTGLKALLLSLKQYIQRFREKRSIESSNVQDSLTSLLQVISQVLEGHKAVSVISDRIWNTSDDVSRQKALWNEFVGLIGGGHILGVCAEAEDIVNDLDKTVSSNKLWISNGSLYIKWLASNISYWVRVLDQNDEQGWKSCAVLLSKSFRLGNTGTIIKELITTLLLQKTGWSTRLEKVISELSGFDQKTFIFATLDIISKEYLLSIVTSGDDSDWWKTDAEVVSASAGLMYLILGNQELRKSQLISWLTASSGAGLGEGIAIRRAAIAALSDIRMDIESVLDRSLQQFGDQLYIRHTPILQQEVHAQVLLLSAGYVRRQAPLHLVKMARSGAYLNLVSNRLAASSPRARFLGMIIGEALSSLTDTSDKKMDFNMEETSTSEARWYKSLVGVSDTVGSFNELKSPTTVKIVNPVRPHRKPPTQKPDILQGTSKIVAIEEIEDDSEKESDKEDLPSYAKPDSDAEDSDEDPTIITRNKSTAPVYIRDLIKYLRDTDNYDKQKLGLQTAAALVRRKANFGTEVSSHAEELASILVGLQDKYELENFVELRSQGMIALLIAQPLKIGQWYSKAFFDGDYSISQRASILITLGLGARELGGFGAENEKAENEKLGVASAFPSKTLPESMHKLYAPMPTSTTTAIDNLSTTLTNTMIAPMAASLADKLTGPSILKVRTFSSRMAVEKKRKKPIANALAKVVADGFFFPLSGRFFIHLKAYGASRSNIAYEPYLLALFIKTLSLLIHASGPSTLSLPQMTSEFWDLLLSLRSQSIGDITVVEALLFGFLTILEINEDKRRLVDAHGRQMLETQEWVEAVFGRVSGGSEEDDRVRMLAAGCLFRLREVVEKYQALLLGDLASFQN
ncbi:telomere length regulation protein-domain-containing protein [Bisporella sp. PMI_857]|nr:telomere length regulation protein-domain-containing protein [Bisporella sp. PMI_857]